jgi:transcriptional regulator with XRE-family HTH domain
MVRRKRDEPVETDEADDADDEDETFGEVFRDMRHHAHLTQAGMATTFGISKKTVSRWELGETMPDPFQKHGIAAAVRAGFPEHYRRMAIAMGFELEAPTSSAAQAAQAAAPSPAILEAALEGALFEAAELLGAPREKVREAVLLVLERIVLVDVDVKSALRMVGKKMGRGGAR